ncbi:MAG: DUF3726 domain-containing protein [Stappiaceae bacterium]
MYSLNEIDAMAKRATRGAGYNWGHAEEAGKATRWLAEHDFSGPELLAQLLTLNDSKSYHKTAPCFENGKWQAREGDLCPLLAGSILSDHAMDISGSGIFEFSDVAYPLFLAPYAVVASGGTGNGAVLFWDELVLHVGPHGVAVSGNREALMSPFTAQVTCRIDRTADVVASLSKCGRVVKDESWRILGKLAQRTFAPATDASRLAGAGAGVSEND